MLTGRLILRSARISQTRQVVGAEAGYYVIPNFSVGAFISYHTNNKYIDRQTLPVSSTSAITSDQQHSIFQLPFGAAFRYNVAPESQFQPYAGVQLGASYSEMSTYMGLLCISRNRYDYVFYTSETDRSACRCLL